MERQRTMGHGSVYQRRSDGLWVGCIDLGVDDDGKRRRRVVSGWSRDVAEAKLIALKADLNFQSRRRTGRPTRATMLAAARRLGTHTESEWRDRLREAQGACFYCGGSTRNRLETDHVIPISRGGSDAISNIVPACRPCSRAKADMTGEEYVRRILRRGWSEFAQRLGGGVPSGEA